MSSKVIHRARTTYFCEDTQLTQQDTKLRIIINMLNDKMKIPINFNRLKKCAESTNIKITAKEVVVDFMKYKVKLISQNLGKLINTQINNTDSYNDSYFIYLFYFLLFFIYFFERERISRRLHVHPEIMT